MKTFALATMLIASQFDAVCISLGAEVSAPGDTAKKQIVQIEQDWINALMKRDVAWFERSIADDWKMLLPNGRIVGKEEFLKPLKDGSLTVDKYTILDLDVRVWGSTAVVLGRGDMQGKNQDGVINHQEHWTDVYVDKDGRWLCVSAALAVTKKAVASAAEAKPGAAPQGLKSPTEAQAVEVLKRLEGEWAITMEVEGRPKTAQLSATCLSAKVLQVTWHEAGSPDAHGLVGWDEGGQQLVEVWFRDGEHVTVRFDAVKPGGGLSGRGEGMITGKKFLDMRSLEFTSPTEYVHTIHGSTVDGKAQPDGKIIGKKVKPSASAK